MLPQNHRVFFNYRAKYLNSMCARNPPGAIVSRDVGDQSQKGLSPKRALGERENNQPGPKKHGLKFMDGGSMDQILNHEVPKRWSS